MNFEISTYFVRLYKFKCELKRRKMAHDKLFE